MSVMDEARRWLAEALLHIGAMGAGAQAAFVLLYAAACVSFLPASILTIGAGALFGLWRGFALVWAGAMLGAWLSFWLGRHWLRGWVERRLARFPVFAAIDAAVSAQGWKVIALARLTPLLPFALLNYSLGLTRVGSAEYLTATAVGMIPGTFLYVYVGAAAGTVARADGAVSSAQRAFFVLGLFATVAVVWLVARAARRQLRLP